MIVSSKVDLICWTGRVGLVCRDCREALTTGDARGARRVSKRAAIEGGRGGCRPFRDLRQLSGEPMPDPSMTAAAASHKAVSWRATGSVDTFVISLFITGKFGLAGAIASVEVITKIILYYLHERAWAIIPWGR